MQNLSRKRVLSIWNRLFRNNHDGTFADVTAKAGLQGKGYGMGAATGDYDNDGDTDLFVTSYGSAVLIATTAMAPFPTSRPVPNSTRRVS